MTSPYITFFIALCIAGFVANLFNFFGKVAIWLGLLIAKNSAKVNFNFNIWAGAILALFIATYFLFL